MFTTKGGLAGFLLICVSLRAADLRQAEDLYQHRKFAQSLAMLDAKGADPGVQFLVGRNYFQLGELKKATEVLTRLTQQHPDNSEYFDWLGKVYGQRADKANPLSAAGLASKARNAFEEAVRLNGSNKDALSDVFDYYLDAPGFMGGGTDKAAAVAKRNLTLNLPEGLLEQARLAEKAKDLKTAESYYRQAVKANPKGIGYYAALARFLSRQGRNDEADAVFAEAFRQRPDAPRLWFFKASLLVKAKRNPDEARQLLRQYLEAPLMVDDPAPEQARELLKQLS